MINQGVLLLRNQPTSVFSTIIVTGIGRSGTSMLGAVLDALGLPLGEFDPHIYEDKNMHYALTYFFPDLRKKLIDENNAKCPNWGFKFPSLHNHLFPAEITQFRNPRLVVITRDLTAVASRMDLTDWGKSEDKLTPIKHAIQQELEMVNFLGKVECPVALFSYEKFLISPQENINYLAAFTGLKVTTNQQRVAISRVKANHQGYIETFHGKST